MWAPLTHSAHSSLEHQSWCDGIGHQYMPHLYRPSIAAAGQVRQYTQHTVHSAHRAHCTPVERTYYVKMHKVCRCYRTSMLKDNYNCLKKSMDSMEIVREKAFLIIFARIMLHTYMSDVISSPDS